MKYGYIGAALVAALLCVASLAQNTTPSTQPSTPQTQPPTTTSPPTQQAPTSPAAAENQSASKPRIAPGSVLPVQLTKTVDAKKAKTGDQVVAKVVADMKTQNGDVLVPKDTKVIGHVTEAQPRNKEQKESQLAIAFDRAEMKDGNAMQIPMSIQAIIGQQQNNPNAAGGGGSAMPPSQGASGAPTGAPGGGSSGSRQGGGMSGAAGASAPPPSATAGAGGGGGEAQAGGAMPQITSQTQGVIGISNLQLSSASGNQGSVMTSDKNNVKLESGTMLLLKVQ
jgi:hypothetical protein